MGARIRQKRQWSQVGLSLLRLLSILDKPDIDTCRDGSRCRFGTTCGSLFELIARADYIEVILVVQIRFKSGGSSEMASQGKLKKTSFQNLWMGGFLVLLGSFAGWAMADESGSGQVLRGDHDDQESFDFDASASKGSRSLLTTETRSWSALDSYCWWPAPEARRLPVGDGGITWQEAEPIPGLRMEVSTRWRCAMERSSLPL